MYRVAWCITSEHNLWLVSLAAIVCVAGAFITARLNRNGVDSDGLQRHGWLFLAAVAFGSSVWSTHFISMLAFHPNAPVVIDPTLTAVSLLVPVVAAMLGFAISVRSRGILGCLSGGVVLASALIFMHYVGMLAYHVDGIVEWDIRYIAVSAFCAVVLTCGATVLTSRGKDSRSERLGALLLVLAVICLHFIGMGALTITPMLLHGADGLPPSIVTALTLVITFIGLVIVGSGLSTILIEKGVRQTNLDRLQYMAMHDSLTGLPNRIALKDAFNHFIDRASENDHFAVAVIDLDQFKEINDIQGHMVGDEVLKIAASRLQGFVNDREFVARVGGDEFMVLKAFRQKRELTNFMSRLHSSLSAPLSCQEYRAPLGASIGVAICPENGTTQEMLTSNADIAMYRAKSSGRGGVCYYEPSMDELVRDRRALGLDLRSALADNEFEIHYQVQSLISTGAIYGYEALLRWKHKTRGFISPAEFIPIAEESGLICEIGAWVIQTACREVASWPQRTKVAVNVSPLQISRSDLVAIVRDALDESKLEAQYLAIELTESTLIENRVKTIAVLNEIRSLGVSVALDDFGSGYSSLDTLRTFPFDLIKLDREFMRDIETSKQSKAIIRAVLALGKCLEIPVLAEGIETRRQLEILREEGCDAGQGFLLGRPGVRDIAVDPAVTKIAS